MAGKRFIALTIKADGSQPLAEVKRIRSAFAAIDADSEKSARKALGGSGSLGGISDAQVRAAVRASDEVAKATITIDRSYARSGASAARAAAEVKESTASVTASLKHEAESVVKESARIIATKQKQAREIRRLTAEEFKQREEARKVDALVSHMRGLSPAQLEKEVAQSAKEARRLSTYSNNLIGESQKAITQAERAASGAETAIARTTKSLTAAKAEATSFGGVIGAWAGPVGVGLGVVATLTLMVGALGLGFVKLAQHSAKVGGEIYDASSKINFAAETVGALKLAADQSGGSLEGLTTGLGYFDKFLGQAEQGGKKQIAVLDRLAISTKDNETALVDAFRVLSRMPEGYAQTTLAMQLFGKGGKDILALIKQTGGDLPAFIKGMKDAGLVMSNDGARAADAFGDKLTELEARLSIVTANIGVKMLPTMLAYINRFEAELQRSGSSVDEVGDIVNRTLLGVIDSIGAVVKAGEVLYGGIVTLIAPFIQLQVVIAYLASSVLHLLSAGFALATGDIATFRSELQAVSNNGSEMIVKLQSIANWAYRAGQTAKEAWSWIARTAGADPLERDVRAAGGHKLSKEEIEQIMRGGGPVRDVNLAGLGGGGGGGGKGGASEKDAATRAAIKGLELQQKTAERVYRETAEAAKRSYDQQSINLDEFVRQSKEAEQALLNSKLATVDAELVAAQKLSKGRDRELQVKELTEKAAAARSEYNRNVQRIDDDAAKTEIQSLRAHQESLLSIGESIDQRSIETYRAIAENRIITQEGLEKKILDIQTAAFNRRLEALTSEERALFEAVGVVYDAAGNMIAGIENAANVNVQEFRRINDQIKGITEKQVATQEEADRRIAAGRQKDIESARQHANQLRSIEMENLNLSIAIGNAKIDQLERLGASPAYIKQQRQAQDVASEILRNRQAQIDILAAQGSVNLQGKTAQEKAEIEALFRERMQLEEVGHQNKMAEIMQRPLVAYREKVKEVSDSIGDILGSSLTSFEGGVIGMLKRIEKGFADLFLNIVKEFIKSKVSKYLQSLFNPRSEDEEGNDRMLGHGGGKGGGFSLSNIFNSFKNLFNSGGGGAATPAMAGGAAGGNAFANVGAATSSSSAGLMNMIFGGGGAAGGAAAAGNAFAGVGAATAGSSAGMMSMIFGGGGAAAGGAGAAAGGAGAGGAAAGGGSMFSSLTPLLTNPWTAVAVGAVVGGLLLWRHFRNGTEKKLREAIKGEYAVDVKDMKTLSEIKAIGEQSFGRGKVKAHLLETIRLEPSKEIIQAYAESTGQNSKLTLNKEYGDAASKENNFVRRLSGGFVDAARRGRDWVHAVLDGGEYVLNSNATERVGVDAMDALNSGDAVVVPRAPVQRLDGGYVPASSGSQSSSSSNGGGSSSIGVTAIMGVLGQLAEQIARISSMPAGQVLAIGAEENPGAVGAAVLATSTSDASFIGQLGRNMGMS
jgi:hypothetical protein